MKLEVKNKSISNYEIEEICKRYDIPLTSVCMKDQLDVVQTGFYIINLQSSHENGSHWVALVCEANECCYFDSFGCVCPQAIQDILLQYYKRVPFNSFIIQDIKSSYCGYYCMLLGLYLKIHNRDRKSLIEKVNDYCNMFYDDTKKNGAVLKKFAKDNT